MAVRSDAPIASRHLKGLISSQMSHDQTAHLVETMVGPLARIPNQSARQAKSTSHLETSLLHHNRRYLQLQQTTDNPRPNARENRRSSDGANPSFPGSGYGDRVSKSLTMSYESHEPPAPKPLITAYGRNPRRQATLQFRSVRVSGDYSCYRKKTKTSQ